MKGEHKMSGDEVDAFGRHRHMLHWRAGERKAIKRLSHKKDRALIRRATGVYTSHGGGVLFIDAKELS